MKKVDQLLVLNTKGPKTRTSFNLIDADYDRFKLFCEMRGIIPSNLVSMLIRDFNTENADEINRYIVGRKKDA